MKKDTWFLRYPHATDSKIYIILLPVAQVLVVLVVVVVVAAVAAVPGIAAVVVARLWFWFWFWFWWWFLLLLLLLLLLVEVVEVVEVVLFEPPSLQIRSQPPVKKPWLYTSWQPELQHKCPSCPTEAKRFASWSRQAERVKPC